MPRLRNKLGGVQMAAKFDREKALELIAAHNPKIKGLAAGWPDAAIEKYIADKSLA